MLANYFGIEKSNLVEDDKKDFYVNLTIFIKFQKRNFHYLALSLVVNQSLQAKIEKVM